MSVNLNAEKGLIFRICHLENLGGMLKQGGVNCPSSANQSSDYVSIGNSSLIDKRARRIVPIEPGGTLSDYVPFYFTPFSIMLYNIKTGYGGITRRENRDIVILVSSVHRLRELGLSFVFTNQHAYAVDTDFYDNLDELRHIDWPLLQRRDFKTDDADPGKQLRYQAEALVHQRVPLEALLGIGCFNDTIKGKVASLVHESDGQVTVKATPTWYF